LFQTSKEGESGQDELARIGIFLKGGRFAKGKKRLEDRKVALKRKYGKINNPVLVIIHQGLLPHGVRGHLEIQEKQ